ncbi:MAG TPA: hypothetical protein VMM79_13840 [Longimicrobiales bacterium]|nr:hypothetical protein [Longimicrobiales bacterium]
MSVETWAEPLLSWIGAAGVLAYILHIHRQRSRSILEAKVLFLLYSLAALFVVRGFYWLTDDVRLQVPAFVPATLLPLAITLFVEALLRRHVSFPLKIFVAAGTFTVFWLNILDPITREQLFTVYKVFMLGTIVWLGAILITRDRRSLSTMENRFITAVSAALACTFLLALTDLQIRPEWLHFRVGSIGALIFVYVCLRLMTPGGSRLAIAGEIAGLTAKSLVAALAFGLLIGPSPTDTFVATFFIATALVLLLTILERIRESRFRNHQASFFNWLAKARTASLDEFMDSLSQLPLAAEHVVLRQDQLTGYDLELLREAFDADRPVATLAMLRASLSRESPRTAAREQLVDMLEKHEMTHATLVSEAPPTVLLLNLPDFVGSYNPVLHVELLQKFGRMLRPA